jgi:hypothetical protein
MCNAICYANSASESGVYPILEESRQSDSNRRPAAASCERLLAFLCLASPKAVASLAATKLGLFKGLWVSNPRCKEVYHHRRDRDCGLLSEVV